MNEIINKISYASNIIMLIVVCILFGSTISDCRKGSNNKQVEILQKQLDAYTMRSSNETVTKEYLDSVIKGSKINISKLEDDMSSLNSKLDSMNQVKIISVPQYIKEVNSTKQEPKPDTQPIEKKDDQYMKNKQILDLYENFGISKVPIGNTSFSAWKNSPWDYNIYGRNYTITNVITKTDEDKTIVYNKFNIEVEGKTYEVPITSSKTIQTNPKSSFKLYPKLFLEYSSGISSDRNLNNAVGLMISPIQYGQSKFNPKFVFASIGAGYSNNGLNIIFSPVMYKIDVVDFIKNVYIGPITSINMSKVFTVGLSLGVSF
jgi:hypothetical protein